MAVVTAILTATPELYVWDEVDYPLPVELPTDDDFLPELLTVPLIFMIICLLFSDRRNPNVSGEN